MRLSDAMEKLTILKAIFFNVFFLVINHLVSAIFCTASTLVLTNDPYLMYQTDKNRCSELAMCHSLLSDRMKFNGENNNVHCGS